MEQADGVRAAADAGDQQIGQPLLALQQLRARLLADHGLKIAHHRRIGMRAGSRADDVERVVHIRDPVAQRLVHRVLERARARRRRDALRRRAGSCGTRSASAARCPPRPCR